MKAITTILLILCCRIVLSQDSVGNSVSSPSFFFAIVVSDIKTSMEWYESVLGFEQVNFREVESYGLTQANLSNGPVNMELIELTSAIYPKDVIPDFNSKTKLVGLFKIGFYVESLSKVLTDLEKNNIDIITNVVEDPTTGSKMMILLDPDGNRVQLFER